MINVMNWYLWLHRWTAYIHKNTHLMQYFQKKCSQMFNKNIIYMQCIHNGNVISIILFSLAYVYNIWVCTLAFLTIFPGVFLHFTWSVTWETHECREHSVSSAWLSFADGNTHTHTLILTSTQRAMSSEKSMDLWLKCISRAVMNLLTNLGIHI